MSRKTKQNTRCYEVTMLVYADADATKPHVTDLIHDLEWVGGQHCPEDPRFYCLDVQKLSVRRAARLDRGVK